jgi:hypothetical protein
MTFSSTSSEFSYSHSYLLDKSHFSETFDESTSSIRTLKDYSKGLIFFGLGAILLVVTEVSAYASWFIIGLGVVEGLSVRFAKPWWLARQMLSKAANTELTLHIDDLGIRTDSFYVKSEMQWTEMLKIEKTQQGWLLYSKIQRSYLSGRCLSEEAEQYIQAKASIVNC